MGVGVRVQFRQTAERQHNNGKVFFLHSAGESGVRACVCVRVWLLFALVPDLPIATRWAGVAGLGPLTSSSGNNQVSLFFMPSRGREEARRFGELHQDDSLRIPAKKKNNKETIAHTSISPPTLPVSLALASQTHTDCSSFYWSIFVGVGGLERRALRAFLCVCVCGGVCVWTTSHQSRDTGNQRAPARHSRAGLGYEPFATHSQLIILPVAVVVVVVVTRGQLSFSLTAGCDTR